MGTSEPPSPGAPKRLRIARSTRSRPESTTVSSSSGAQDSSMWARIVAKAPPGLSVMIVRQ